MRFIEFFAVTWLFLAVGTTPPAMADESKEDTAAVALGEPLSDTDLSTYRGGSALQLSAMKLDSSLLDNQAMDNITGNNFVTESAFTGASGFSTVVQNSGNNVIIQNATILNLNVH